MQVVDQVREEFDMAKKAQWILIAGALAALLIPTSAFAKGPFEMVTASGPDWFGEIEITDAETLEALGVVSFMDADRPVPSPRSLGRGYLLTRGYFSGEGDAKRFTPFDRVMVFPGSPGYVYYIEIVNGSGPMDGKWYRLTEAGQAALLGALEAAGVPFASSRALSPVPAPAADPTAWLVPALTALVGATAGWIVGRSRSERPATSPA